MKKCTKVAFVSVFLVLPTFAFANDCWSSFYSGASLATTGLSALHGGVTLSDKAAERIHSCFGPVGGGARDR